MAEFIPAPTATPSRRLASVREDVHIHAPYNVVRDRLLAIAKNDEWLGEQFRDYAVSGETLSFTLALPGRTESAHITVDDSDQIGVR